MENNSKNMEKSSNNIEQKLNTMEQNSTLSNEAQAAIINFVEKNHLIDSTEILNFMIVSLYALQSYAKKDVISTLKEYHTDLYEFLSKDEIEALQKDFKEVVKCCLMFKDASRLRNLLAHTQLITQNTAAELCTKMALPAPGSDILLPYFCPELYAYLRSDYSCYGYVDSQEAWAFSQIMADVFNVNAQIKVGRFDEDSDKPRKQYDYIFAFAPMLLRLGGIRTNEDFILMANELLKDNGEMFCCLPYEAMYMTGWDNFRKMVVDNNFEIKVITLARNIHLGYRESCVISLMKTHTGGITLVNTINYDFMNRPNYDTTLGKSEADLILETIEKDTGDFVWKGDANLLMKEKYDFRPEIYLMENELPIPQGGENLMKLGDLVEVIPSGRLPFSSTDELYPIIGMKDLSTDYLRCEIGIDNLEKSSRGIYKLLSSDALLFSVSGNLRVAKLSVDNKKIGIEMGIIPMKLKFKNLIITEDFLLRALTLHETFKQVQLYTRGRSFIRFSIEDFLRLQIIVPPLDRQKEICLHESRECLSEADKKLIEEQSNFRRDIHMKRHAIGQTIHNLSNWWEILQAARKEGNGVVDDKAFYDDSDPTPIIDIYANIGDAIAQLQNQIYSFDRGNGMIAEDIALTEFIENYIDHHRHTEFTYEYDSLSHHYNEDESKMSYYRFVNHDREGNRIMQSEDNIILMKDDFIERVKFPKKALEIIFDNIISNACAHGFLCRNVGNIVKIELNSEGLNHVITISNNGKPLDPQFTEKDVFVYGETSHNGGKHYGLGGSEVYELMREFGGRAEFISTPEEEFPVTYKLTFSKTNIVATWCDDDKFTINDRDFENIWDYIELVSEETED